MPQNVSYDQPAPENVLPQLDLRALARRAALPAALAAVAVAVLVLAGGPLQAFADALGRVLDADPRWVVAGAAFELISFAGYVALESERHLRMFTYSDTREAFAARVEGRKPKFEGR